MNDQRVFTRISEKLVVDLLLAMGYGGTKEDAGQAIGRRGDGGIDGIIKEDKLGIEPFETKVKFREYTKAGLLRLPSLA